MMRRHVERLDAIVEDLLSLSRIEYDAEHNKILTEPGAVCDVLREAVQSFAGAAAAKNIVIVQECSGDLCAPINARLLGLAIGNLVDNAIKYSENGTQVTVAASKLEEVVEISVTDQGLGIEKKHLDRIFERFYRIDAARSRGLGGTGLGLSIVKHTALAHRGSVSVESAPGRGSSFKIRIPLR
jgi:two-component system phosphate regulon sensor histidine kinase PhoR